MYDALGYSEAISNQAKLMVNSSPLIEGKYNYSKERKGVFVIFIYNTKILLPLTFDEQTEKKNDVHEDCASIVQWLEHWFT